MGIEWVQPKGYKQYEWQPDLGDEKGGSKKGKPGKARITLYGPEKKAKAASIETPNEFGPTEKAPPKKNTPKAIGPGSRPHEGPAKPALPEGPSLRALPGSRTVAAEEAGRQARADLVKSVMDSKYSDRRQRGSAGWPNMNTGSIHTGVVTEDPRAVGGRTPLALPTRGTASTGVLPTIGRTGAIPRVTPHDQTVELQAVAPARTPFAMRTPIPVGSGRNPEQLAMFHVPGEPVNPSLSTRQQGPIAMSSGSKVSKLAARPTPGKKPGDQGVLFQPARYRSVQ
jgi:hypothetical protein